MSHILSEISEKEHRRRTGNVPKGVEKGGIYQTERDKHEERDNCAKEMGEWCMGKEEEGNQCPYERKGEHTSLDDQGEGLNMKIAMSRLKPVAVIIAGPPQTQNREKAVTTSDF